MLYELVECLRYYAVAASPRRDPVSGISLAGRRINAVNADHSDSTTRFSFDDGKMRCLRPCLNNELFGIVTRVWSWDGRPTLDLDVLARLGNPVDVIILGLTKNDKHVPTVVSCVCR